MSENSDITPEDADWLKELRSTFERDDSFNEFKLRIALPSSSDAFTGKTDIRKREVTNQRADEMDEFLNVAVAPYGLKLFHQLIGEVLKEFPSETVARVGGIKDWKGPAKSIKAEFLAEMRAALFKGLGFLETSATKKGAPGGNEIHGQTALAKEQLRETPKERAQQHEPSPIDSREQWQKQEAERFEADGLALRCFAVKHMVALYNKALDRARAYDRRYKSQHFGRIVDGKYQRDYEKIRLGPEWNAIKGPSYGYEGFCLEKNLQLDGTLSYDVVRRRQPTVGNYAMFILNGMAKEKTPEAVVGAMMGGVIASMIAVATRRPYANSMSRDEAMQLEVGRHLTDILSKRPPNGPPGGPGGHSRNDDNRSGPPLAVVPVVPGPTRAAGTGGNATEGLNPSPPQEESRPGGSAVRGATSTKDLSSYQVDEDTSDKGEDASSMKGDEDDIERANAQLETTADKNGAREKLVAVQSGEISSENEDTFPDLQDHITERAEKLDLERKGDSSTKRRSLFGIDPDKPMVRPDGTEIKAKGNDSSNKVGSNKEPKLDTKAIKRALQYKDPSAGRDKDRNITR